MKKIYNAPEITVIEQDFEPFMLDTSIVFGGNNPGSVDAKGGQFDFEEDDDEDDWNGWN